MPISNPPPIPPQLETSAFGRSLITQPNGASVLPMLGFATIPTDTNSQNPEVIINDAKNGFDYKPRFFHAKGLRGSDQAIPNNVVTPINWSETAHHPLVSSELFMLNVSTPARITIRHDGIYLIVAQVYWQDNSNGTARLARINRTSGSTTTRLAESRLPAMIAPALCCAAIHRCFNGDFIELAAFQNSGASLSITSGTSLAVSQLFL
ncbi:hypothetical protein [Egbenema bharatensis]|uniref:hypothetical protein n=1 Tax=Egbenema bharatensis TaxID=3463334 RepID=UPI003A8536FB